MDGDLLRLHLLPRCLPHHHGGFGSGSRPAWAKDFQVIFISVDPERDKPETLKSYLANESFPAGTIGLTGSREQVAVAAKAYRVFFEKSGAGSDYLVNHSTAIYLMDPKGQFAKVLPFGIGADEVARQISDAMRP